MRAPREYRRIINRARKKAAKGRKPKRNGSIGWFDSPWCERLLYNSKHMRALKNPHP